MPTYDFRDKEDKGSKKKQIGNLYAFFPIKFFRKIPAGSIQQICSKSPIPKCDRPKGMYTLSF